MLKFLIKTYLNQNFLIFLFTILGIFFKQKLISIINLCFRRSYKIFAFNADLFAYEIIFIYWFTMLIQLHYFDIIAAVQDNLLFFYTLEWLVLFTSILFINYLGVKGLLIINWIFSLLFVISLIFLFPEFNLFNKAIYSEIGDFFKFNVNETISLVLYIDNLNYNFCLLTGLISLCVYLYAYSYMRNDLNIINFFFYLKFFVLSMILLLLAGNWVTLLLGWELIGITSFLLINFWTNKITTLKSAFKAFTFNKISDCFLIIAFLIVLFNKNSLLNGTFIDNNLFFYKNILLFNIYFEVNDIFLICLLISSFCKSAQFGFHFWLPDSMEAPVPASALIHSATLVSAGIYLLLRYNYLFNYSIFLSYIFILISSFTALYGAIISSFQTDVKKILAYSTISHCGFLMSSIYFCNIYITLLYLFGHGFYKSLSFMCVGNLIQSSNNYQDFRKMGNYSYYNIFEFFFLFICILNLGSLPFFFNFFTKHFLMNSVNSLNMINLLAITFIYLASFCGIFYSSRLIFYCFLNFKKTHYTFYTINYINNIDLYAVPQKVENSLFALFNILYKSNKLSILSMFILFLLNILIIIWFMYLYIFDIIFFIEINNYFQIFFFLNKNFFFFKIIFFYILYSLLYIFISYKNKNLFELQYLWLYFILLLLL